MIINLEEASGLPITVDPETCQLILGTGLNEPSYRIRMLHDLDGVWANPVPDTNSMIYQYTSGLWLAEDEEAWKRSNIIYGIVIFVPGAFAGEFNKSSGQYHPIVSPNTNATPEIYSVLHGTGHFLLQKSSPPYEIIEDAVMVEVQAGETFIVPPDYGHLQINPGKDPLIFSYAVMDRMQGVYEPFKKMQGAMYYEMDNDISTEKYVFNLHYFEQVPLRFIKAAEICQIPAFDKNVTYQKIRDNLQQLEFLTNPEKFPESAIL